MSWSYIHIASKLSAVILEVVRYTARDEVGLLLSKQTRGCWRASDVSVSAEALLVEGTGPGRGQSATGRYGGQGGRFLEGKSDKSVVHRASGGPLPMNACRRCCTNRTAAGWRSKSRCPLPSLPEGVCCRLPNRRPRAAAAPADVSHLDFVFVASRNTRLQLTRWPVLPIDLRQRIDSHPRARDQIALFKILNVDFFPREANLITFRDPWSFPTLFHPACDGLVRNHMQELTQKVSVQIA